MTSSTDGNTRELTSPIDLRSSVMNSKIFSFVSQYSPRIQRTLRVIFKLRMVGNAKMVFRSLKTKEGPFTFEEFFKNKVFEIVVTLDCFTNEIHNICSSQFVGVAQEIHQQWNDCWCNIWEANGN